MFIHVCTCIRRVASFCALRSFVLLYVFCLRRGLVVLVVFLCCILVHDPTLHDLLRLPLTLHEHTPNTARRTNKQIFLSVDVPPTFLSGGGGRTLLEVERAAIGVLRELEMEGAGK